MRDHGQPREIVAGLHALRQDHYTNTNGQTMKRKTPPKRMGFPQLVEIISGLYWNHSERDIKDALNEAIRQEAFDQNEKHRRANMDYADPFSDPVD